MASITIEINDLQLQKLEDLAKANGVSPTALLLANVENWLNSPQPEFDDAAKYVLKKNTELYSRLA
jgi:antitoxin FitA